MTVHEYECVESSMMMRREQTMFIELRHIR